MTLTLILYATQLNGELPFGLRHGMNTLLLRRVGPPTLLLRRVGPKFQRYPFLILVGNLRIGSQSIVLLRYLILVGNLRIGSRSTVLLREGAGI